EDDDHEYAACPLADHITGQRSDGAGLVADTRPDGPGIVHASEEDGTEDHPEKRRRPTPDDRDGRPHNRRGPGNRGEMVTPENVFVGGHEIDAVFQLMGRRTKVRV